MNIETSMIKNFNFYRYNQICLESRDDYNKFQI